MAPWSGSVLLWPPALENKGGAAAFCRVMGNLCLLVLYPFWVALSRTLCDMATRNVLPSLTLPPHHRDEPGFEGIGAKRAVTPQPC